jgi:hypothetical protein
MPSALTPAWLYIGAAVLTGLAALLFVGGWLWMGGVLLLLATPLDGVAERLAALRLQASVEASWPARSLPFLGAAALCALGYRLAQEGGWGALLLALVTVAFSCALSVEKRGRRLPYRHLLAERKGMTWLMLPFAIAGVWLFGLAALAAYAAGSFFWAQQVVHRPGTKLQQD